MIKKVILTIFIFSVLFIPSISLAKEQVEVLFFHSVGCPHCQKEALFLDKLEDKYGDKIVIERLEVGEEENIKLLMEYGEKLDVAISGVPFTVIGDKYFNGYLSDETTGFKIEEALKELLNKANQLEPIDNPNINKVANNISVPIFGQIDLKSFSLPIATIILGTLDGFNPCAMWALIFLISLLLGMQDRKRMWILGSTFIVTSALIYFLFMAAWLNIILFLGFILWVRIVIALVALGGGALNIKKYFKNKNGACEVSDGEKRRKIFDKLKEVATQKKFILAFFGIIALAFAVNLVELICSAGLPAIYAQILAMNNLSSLQHYLYILLYIFFFMLDDLLVFFIAMITLQLSGVSTKYSRFSNLIGGILMLIIGLLLIFKPGWLTFG